MEYEGFGRKVHAHILVENVTEDVKTRIGLMYRDEIRALEMWENPTIIGLETWQVTEPQYVQTSSTRQCIILAKTGDDTSLIKSTTAVCVLDGTNPCINDLLRFACAEVDRFAYAPK